MLRFLHQCSRKRTAWLLLMLSALVLEGIALWFQHVMQLMPCVLCIYQRCAVLGVAGAGLIGLIAPGTLLRYLALLVWLFSAVKGGLLSLKHTMLILHPSPFSSCDFVARFPDWLPLGKWLPQVFAAYGDCTARQWHWLGLEMPQWLLGIFVLYGLLAILAILGQFVRPKKRSVRLFH